MEPEEKVIRLLIRPNNFDYNACESDLTYYDTVPNTVKQIKPRSIMYVSLVLTLVEIHLEELEDVDKSDNKRKIAAFPHNGRNQSIKIKPIKNSLRM